MSLQRTVSDFMRFSIDSTALVEFNPGIVLTTWFETGPATKQVGEHKIPFKSRTDKCELATTQLNSLKTLKTVERNFNLFRFALQFAYRTENTPYHNNLLLLCYFIPF